MIGLEDLASSLVNGAYVQQGVQSLKSHQSLLKTLLSERRMPEMGWSDGTIQMALHELSSMDSNNFHANAGVGEREGRVYSSLVSQRHTHLSHGIGRSGDLDEVQPKAAGSSLIYKLTMAMAMHALHIAGVEALTKCLVVPLATGMSLSLCLLTVRAKLCTSPDARYVIWPRIDQKSSFKCIMTAGLIPLVVENVVNGDAIETDVEAVARLLASDEYKGKVVAVLSTTSCFAPRRPDKIDALARLCNEHSVAHVINNAYGLQCPGISRLINRACAVGRVDFVVSSTDKNFMVPVGGAVVASPVAAKVEWVSKMYPGRASMAPILDLFITFLSMGASGYTALLKERLRLLPLLIERVGEVAARHGERVLVSPYNTISVGVTLSALGAQLEAPDKDLSFLGSMLFQRCVSGTRVIPQGGTKTVGPHTFEGWGASASAYPYPYLTAACAMGLTEKELDLFCTRLDKALGDFRKKRKLPVSAGVPVEAGASAEGKEGGEGEGGRRLFHAWNKALATKRW